MLISNIVAGISTSFTGNSKISTGCRLLYYGLLSMSTGIRWTKTSGGPKLFVLAYMLSTMCVAEEPHIVWHSGQLLNVPVAQKTSLTMTERALQLNGLHSLKMDGTILPAEMKAFSVTAWVRPEKFDRYNEIFRIESGKGRVLFSFQENGTVLALGLDVDGRYQECDAPVKPERLLDGRWHFAAATFDGKEMALYLDGIEIGRLAHPGTALVARLPGYIGSHTGRGEFFQGGMDDLSLYTEALSPEMISAEYSSGITRLMGQVIQNLPDEWKPLLKDQSTFAATLLEARRFVSGTGQECPSVIADLLDMKLVSCFPLECRDYVNLFGRPPASFVTMKDLSGLRSSLLSRLVRQTEYMPLTEDQWSHCSEQEHSKWQQVKDWSDKFAARINTGDSLEESLLAALVVEWPATPERPVVAEPVAPYVPPSTLEPKSWSADEMSAAIENDWMRQVENKPDLKNEIRRTRKIASRLKIPVHGLDEIENAASDKSVSPDKMQDLYLSVRRIKRNLMLGNPAVDFSEILLVDMPYPQGREWPHETRHRLGYMAVPGGQLLVLKFAHSTSSGQERSESLKFGKVTGRRLMPQKPLHGSFWRPDLSYDARRVLFCFKPHNEKSFHIYAVNLDGTGLRQLTSGIFDDFDPVYLPDGKNFVFSSTRGHTYVRCMPPTNAYNLMRCGLNGENLYFISANNEPDYLPALMNDGRIIYTRWEYTDKPLWRAQSLWTVNPDGTQPNAFWGNQSVWPDLLKDARPIPGSRRVMFTGSAHHNWFAGSIGIIDPDKGLNFPKGLTKVTAELAWPECGNGPVDPVESSNYHSYGTYDAYQTPYPLSERDFLVSAKRDNKFVLYLMDIDGNRELIYEGVNQIFHAIPIRPRQLPPVRPDHVKWPSMADRLHPADGIIYSANVWYGAPPELKQKAKFLRILHIEQKTYTYWNRRPALSTGPVVSLLQSDGVKRVLGTVPIESDGSVNFRAPAGVALHFQLLDANHRALQTMRSFANVMPGESRGCLGCHELHSRAPQQDYGAAMALQKDPDSITPVPWAFDEGFSVAPDGCDSIADAVGANNHLPFDNHSSAVARVRRFGTSVSYLKDVQPVLDRYCGNCHQGEGKGRKTLDLTLRGYEPYKTLIGYPGWGNVSKEPEECPPGYDIAGTLKVENYGKVDPDAYRTPEPMTRLSYTSKLVALAAGGKHHDVKVDPFSLLRLILWVDAMCPYRCDEDIRQMEDPVFQGSEWLAIRPRLKSAPVVIRPGPFKAHDNGNWLEN